MDNDEARIKRYGTGFVEDAFAGVFGAPRHFYMSCIAVVSLGLGIGAYKYLDSRDEVEIERLRSLRPDYGLRREKERDGPEPELFYDIEGNRAYIEIDGRAVESHNRE